MDAAFGEKSVRTLLYKPSDSDEGVRADRRGRGIVLELFSRGVLGARNTGSKLRILGD